MTGVSRPPRVRPFIRRSAIVACAILLPVAAHSAWDYVEVRRLVAEIEAIQARGEPVSERLTVAPPPSSSNPATAATYYMAGAVLALPSRPYGVVAPVREWLAGAQPDRAELPRLTEALNGLVRDSQEAIALADRAAGMPFSGFPPGTEFNYRTMGLVSLSQLLAARTLATSVAGQGDAGVASAVSSLRVRRALRNRETYGGRGHDVPAVLSLSSPSAASLEQLQKELADQDDPNRSWHDVLRDRAAYIDVVWRRYYGTDPVAPRSYRLPTRSIGESLTRPWFTHRVVHVLRVWAELGDAARVPWPGKAQASGAVLEKYREEQDDAPGYLGPYVGLGFPSASFRGAVDPTQLIVDRASRVAVAIEQFRRDRGMMPATLADLAPHYLLAVPEDPYTARALLFRASAGRYTIYSVGPNGKDDGGDLTSEFERIVKQGYGRRVIAGTDIGIRVIDLR